MNSTTIEQPPARAGARPRWRGGWTAGGGANERRRPWFRDPGHLLTAVATVAAGLSVLSLWWALPTAVAAFLAGRRPGRTLPTALVLLALLAAGLVAISVVPAWLELSSIFVAVVVVAAMVPWFSGRFWRQYQDLVRAGWQRAGQLEREQQLVAEQARLQERARIAQDMHDVLGHDLSLIALSAGALQLSPDLDERHRAAARDIRGRAASAVERLGEVIGVLRDASDGVPDRSSGSSLERLVTEAAAAGLAVRLQVTGEAGTASPSPVAERAAYRVVQEALTNAAKHAPSAEVTVAVTYGDAEVEVRVVNGPPPGAAARPPLPRGAARAGQGAPAAVSGAGTVDGTAQDAGRAAEGADGHGAARWGGARRTVGAEGAGGAPPVSGPTQAPAPSPQPADEQPFPPVARPAPVRRRALLRGGAGPRDAAGPSATGHGAVGGRGLIGLDERVRLAGGSFTCGPREGGFAVAARIPHTPPAHPERPAPALTEVTGWPADGHPDPGRAATGPLPREHQWARRRVRRTLVAALMLPLVTGALLSAVLVVWNAVATSSAVLDPADYARLRVGQDRAEVERVLPERQTVHRPSADEPEGRDVTCAYYALTADPFDDRSGDAYRLCFRANTLVSLDVLMG